MSNFFNDLWINYLVKKPRSVICYLDDVLILGNNIAECFERTKRVLYIFSKHYVKIREDKSIFFSEHIQYLGFEISTKGIRVIPDKIKTILEAPEHQNVTQLKSFMGISAFLSSTRTEYVYLNTKFTQFIRKERKMDMIKAAFKII